MQPISFASTLANTAFSARGGVAARANASALQTPVPPVSAIRQRAQEAHLEADIQQFAAEAGVGANISVTYRYTVGPDGQLQLAGAEVRSSERILKDSHGNRVNNAPYGQAGGLDARLAPLSQLSSDALKALQEENASDSAFTARLKARDLAVRVHEGLHLDAAGGLVQDGPEYTFQRGPDGNYYAVGGDVDVQASATHDPQKARRDALGLQLAATAPADASAADMAVATTSAFRAAGIYAQSRQPLLDIAA